MCPLTPSSSLRSARRRVYVAAFLIDAMAYAYHVLVPIRAQDVLGAGPETLGLLGTAATGCYALSCFVTGKWSDRWGSRGLCQGGLVLVAAVVLPLVWWATSVEHFFAANVLLGVGLGLFWPPLERQLALLSPARSLWRTVGTFNCCWAAGIALGSVGGPNVYEFISYGTGVVFCLTLVLSALAILIPRFSAANTADSAEDPQSDHEGTEHGSTADRGREGALGQSPRYGLFLYLSWVSNFAGLFAYQGAVYLLPYVSRQLQFGISRLGILLFSLNAARLAMFFLLRQLGGWQYSVVWLSALQLAGGISLVGLAFTRSALVFQLLLAVVGAFIGLSYFSSLFYGLNSGSEHGKKSGIHEGILALGMTFGPLVCGWFGKQHPDWPGAVLLPAAAAVLGALLIELGLVGVSRRRHNRRGGAQSGVER